MSEEKPNPSLLFTLDSSFTRIYQQDRDYLLGRVLTVIDALGMNPDQSKSVKDLIHSAFFEYRERHQKLAGELFERLYEAKLGKKTISEFTPNNLHGNRLPSIVK
jgi:hypothetical protein